MQLGTGEKSWAQLTWSYITARAWANSVYAIAPNQRLVYLMGGEMLYHLDKHRKDKSDYFVWTKLIQARIRGTTVLFQCTGDTTRVTVMEGSIDVMNRKDKSIIHIEPGVVYEVKDLQGQSVIEGPTASSTSSSSNNQNISLNSSADGSRLSGHLTAAAAQKSTPIESLRRITASGLEPVKVFQTQQTLTTIYQADVNNLLIHPLLSTLEEPLTSLPLVTKSLTALLPLADSLLSDTTGLLGKTLLSESKVLSVPKTVNYDVGGAVGKAFTLPAQTVSFFPPVGIIGHPGESISSVLNPAIGQGITHSGVGGVLPGTNLSGIAGATGISGIAGAVGTSGIAGISGAAGALGAVGASGMAGVSGLTTGFSQVSGAALGAGRIPVGLPGVGAGGAGLTGATGLTGVVGGVTGTVGSLTNGTVSGLTGGVNTLLQNATGGINHLLNGTGGGVLGLPLGR